MPAEPTRGNIRTGDVSGNVIIGNNNSVTTTNQHPEQPHQQNFAGGQGTVFAVENGDMIVMQNTTAAHEAEGEEDG